MAGTSAGFVAVAAASDVPPGAVRAVRAAGADLVLVHDGTDLHALAARCTHAAGPLDEGAVIGVTGGEADGDCRLRCPWHGAIFRPATGEVLRGPARKPLRRYPVRVVDGEVWVDVSESA
jgi:nitrite reductase/ring-hydroxylating ferredoxin subunit